VEGEYDHRQLRPPPLELFEHVDPVHARQRSVEQNQVERVLPRLLNRFGAGAGFLDDHDIGSHLQNVLEAGTHDRVIRGNQHAQHGTPILALCASTRRRKPIGRDSGTSARIGIQTESRPLSDI